MRALSALIMGALAACSPNLDNAPERSPITELEPDAIQSGYAFLTQDTQRLQDDDFENPGYLWVERGRALFETASSTAPACASCHAGGLDAVAATYPAIDETTGALINLEGRINQCRTTHQDLPALAYESDDLLALTTYVANASKGVPQSVEISDRTAPYLEQGQDYFLTRRGQFNLSCQQCHTETWGKQLRGDTISQGHSNGFPAYRFEWQSVGSLHRRLRDCDTGVRAEPLPYGDETYIALELYLAARGNGLEVETPAVRR
ncbi:MAG: sulfur oxidation c-type cytochrome SoxA [Pseudomonadota bacterium]|nr:sulfur oxidation c-type cytochrome SoxA [Pseudomonadota bacterium]